MRNRVYSEKTQVKMRSRYGNKRYVKGRYKPKFPVGAEREYLRVMNQYMLIIKAVIEEDVPKLKTEYKAYQNERNDGMRQDAAGDFAAFLALFINGMLGHINRKMEDMDFFGKHVKALRRIGAITKQHEIKEWKKQVKKTLGINLYEDYYKGDFFQDQIERWVSDNVGLIVTIPEDMLGRMREIILEGFEKGRSTTEITKQIQESYGISKRHARLIARDQMGKLHAAIRQKEHADAGLTRYEWSDSGDERVRPSHRRLNGKIYEYRNPPETDGGRHCNPGEDFQCRCVDLEVFDFDNLKIPVEYEDEYG